MLSVTKPVKDFAEYRPDFPRAFAKNEPWVRWAGSPPRQARTRGLVSRTSTLVLALRGGLAGHSTSLFPT